MAVSTKSAFMPFVFDEAVHAYFEPPYFASTYSGVLLELRKLHSNAPHRRRDGDSLMGYTFRIEQPAKYGDQVFYTDFQRWNDDAVKALGQAYFEARLKADKLLNPPPPPAPVDNPPYEFDIQFGELHYMDKLQAYEPGPGERLEFAHELWIGPVIFKIWRIRAPKPVPPSDATEGGSGAASSEPEDVIVGFVFQITNPVRFGGRLIRLDASAKWNNISTKVKQYYTILRKTEDANGGAASALADMAYLKLQAKQAKRARTT